MTLATIRDGSSGGICRMMVVTEKGAEPITVLPDQLPAFSEDLH